MAGAKILCAYTMENADVGYFIEVDDVMVAKQLELFLGCIALEIEYTYQLIQM